MLAETPKPAELRAARKAAHAQGPIAAVLQRMNKAGYWAAPGPGYNPKYRSTVWSIILLAQLGASAEDDPRIPKACAYLLDHALHGLRPVHRLRRPLRHGGLPAGQPVLGAAGAGLRGSAPGEGLRLDGAHVTGEGIAPVSDRGAPCATMPASAARPLPAAPTTNSPAPGAAPR